ncbi:hypothetical protein PAPYR_2543 [Paratrimastix pyriformis]|uniref:PNPLA domain-containing protein n=1 Tax=Paratrimastix pyriformis TaxID=342808 RepID=A0ABQ8UPK4_9EUKA|nr:hypothetical protein PAPYR_2543 [Paratrimastix pyriformis]
MLEAALEAAKGRLAEQHGRLETEQRSLAEAEATVRPAQDTVVRLKGDCDRLNRERAGLARELEALKLPDLTCLEEAAEPHGAEDARSAQMAWRSMRGFEAKQTELAAMVEQLERKMDEEASEVERYKRHVAHYHKFLLEWTEHAHKAEAELKNYQRTMDKRMEEAHKQCPEDPNDERPQEEIKREMTGLRHQITLHEQNHRPQRVVAEEFARAKADLDLASVTLQSFKETFHLLAEALTDRQTKWVDLRARIFRDFIQGFAIQMQHRNMVGTMNVDHNAGTLDPRRAGALGGERSFTTSCLLMALWNLMQCPFRLVDESVPQWAGGVPVRSMHAGVDIPHGTLWLCRFDVFCDETTRRTSSKLLLEQAKSKRTQFIMITPLDVSDWASDPDIKFDNLPSDPGRMDKNSIEYNIAWELEMWKSSEKARWQENLLRERDILVERLTSVWAATKQDQEKTIQKKEEEIARLNQAINKEVAEVETKEKQAVIEKKQLDLERSRMDDEYKMRETETKQLVEQMQAELTRSREIAQLKCSEVEQTVAGQRSTLAYLRTDPEVALKVGVAQATAKIEELKKNVASAEAARDTTQAQRDNVLAKIEANRQLHEEHLRLLLEAERTRLAEIQANLAAQQHKQDQERLMKQQAEEQRLLALQRQQAALAAAAQCAVSIPVPAMEAEKARLQGEVDSLMATGLYTESDRLVAEIRRRCEALGVQTKGLLFGYFHLLQQKQRDKERKMPASQSAFPPNGLIATAGTVSILPPSTSSGGTQNNMTSPKPSLDELLVSLHNNLALLSKVVATPRLDAALTEALLNLSSLSTMLSSPDQKQLVDDLFSLLLQLGTQQHATHTLARFPPSSTPRSRIVSVESENILTLLFRIYEQLQCSFVPTLPESVFLAAIVASVSRTHASFRGCRHPQLMAAKMDAFVKASPHLVFIDLSCCGLSTTEDGLLPNFRVVTRALARLPQLRVLLLEGNDIDDAGAAELLAVLRGAPPRPADERSTPAGATAWPNLHLLGLKGNPISGPVLLQLEEQLIVRAHLPTARVLAAPAAQSPSGGSPKSFVATPQPPPEFPSWIQRLLAFRVPFPAASPTAASFSSLARLPSTAASAASSSPQPTPPPSPSPAPRRFRVLTLDGGGVRGLIEIEILLSFEEALRRRAGDMSLTINHLFDLVCGTSTGGLLASAIQSGIPLTEIKAFYLRFPQLVFARKSYVQRALWGYAYSTKALRDAIRLALPGADQTILAESPLPAAPGARSTGPRPVMLVTTDFLTGNPITLCNYASPMAPPALTLLPDAICATAAAPTFFPQALLDLPQAVAPWVAPANGPALSATASDSAVPPSSTCTSPADSSPSLPPSAPGSAPAPLEAIGGPETADPPAATPPLSGSTPAPSPPTILNLADASPMTAEATPVATSPSAAAPKMDGPGDRVRVRCVDGGMGWNNPAELVYLQLTAPPNRPAPDSLALVSLGTGASRPSHSEIGPQSSAFGVWWKDLASFVVNAITASDRSHRVAETGFAMLQCPYYRLNPAQGTVPGSPLFGKWFTDVALDETSPSILSAMASDVHAWMMGVDLNPILDALL